MSLFGIVSKRCLKLCLGDNAGKKGNEIALKRLNLV